MHFEFISPQRAKGPQTSQPRATPHCHLVRESPRGATPQHRRCESRKPRAIALGWRRVPEALKARNPLAGGAAPLGLEPFFIGNPRASPGQRPRIRGKGRPALKGRDQWCRPFRAGSFRCVDPGRCPGLACLRTFGAPVAPASKCMAGWIVLEAIA